MTPCLQVNFASLQAKDQFLSPSDWLKYTHIFVLSWNEAVFAWSNHVAHMAGKANVAQTRKTTLIGTYSIRPFPKKIVWPAHPQCKRNTEGKELCECKTLCRIGSVHGPPQPQATSCNNFNSIPRRNFSHPIECNARRILQG